MQWGRYTRAIFVRLFITQSTTIDNEVKLTFKNKNNQKTKRRQIVMEREWEWHRENKQHIGKKTDCEKPQRTTLAVGSIFNYTNDSTNLMNIYAQWLPFSAIYQRKETKYQFNIWERYFWKKKQNFAILVRLRWDLCRTHNIDAEEGETIRWTQHWMTMPADFIQNGTFFKKNSR